MQHVDAHCFVVGRRLLPGHHRKEAQPAAGLDDGLS